MFQSVNLVPFLTAEENLRFHAVMYGVPAKEIAPRMDPLLEMVGNMSPCDLILIEGFRDMAIERIRVFELEANPRTVAELDPQVVAVVGTKTPEGYSVPAFQRDDALPIATFILAHTGARPRS